jgi:hypothetical protein
MNSDDYIGVSLRVFHQSRSPNDISATLERQANNTGFKGELRGARGRRGHDVGTAATWREHYWSSDFAGGTVEECLVTIADLLTKKEKEVLELAQQGRIEIYVFLPPVVTIGIELDAKLLAVFGRLGVASRVRILGPKSSSVVVTHGLLWHD